MRQPTSILTAALVAGAMLAPGGALAQAPDATSSPSSTSSTTSSTSTSLPPAPTTAPPPPNSPVAPSTTVAPATTTTSAPPELAPERASSAPKVRGVGDSVFYSAQSKVIARLQPEYRPRFQSVLGATIADMTPAARRMVANGPPAMVLSLGNPDIAEMDSGWNPYPPATRLLHATRNVPCVVWVNLKQRGVNRYYNVNWQRDATAFDKWLVNASLDGPGNDLYYPNLHILDWNRATVGHPSWFLADGLHLNATGQASYARRIDRFLNRVCPP